MGRHPLNLQVVGWYGKNNVGDESYKLSIPTIFRDSAITFRSFPTRGFDGYVLGGGDCLNEDILTKLKGITARKFLLSVSVSADYPKDLLDQFDRLVVRDQRSLDVVRAAGVEAVLAPDIAFLLTPDRDRGRRMIAEMFEAERRDLYQKVVVVVCNGHLLRGQDARQQVAFEKLAHDLAYVADWTDASFLFLPFGTNAPWDDRAANAYVNSRPKWWKKNLTVFGRSDPQAALDIIAGADAVVSMRLHSSIFATVAGVPFVDVTHNHKNSEFLKGVGLTDWSVPFMTFDAERATGLLKTFLADEASRASLGDLARRQREALLGVLSDVRFN